jgi:hypothetical protein
MGCRAEHFADLENGEQRLAPEIHLAGAYGRLTALRMRAGLLAIDMGAGRAR